MNGNRQIPGASPPGVAAAAGAFVIWGVLPIYWKALQAVSPVEILCHRMSWSLVVTMALLLVLRRQQGFFTAIRNRQNLLAYGGTAILLGINWLVYIWVVNAGFIIETSLAYFINPLLSVLFGVFFFQERLRRSQILALVLVFAGIVWLTVFYGRFPWIALFLASTFAVYGLLHKKGSLPALSGLALETMVVFVPATAFLFYLELRGTGAFGAGDLHQALLLAGSGIITSVPLLLFSFAAQRIPLSVLGLLQYIAPTLNLLIGLFVYHEDFPLSRLIGFAIIWIALLLYLLEGFFARWRVRRRSLYL